MQIANIFVPGAIISIILGLLVCFFGYKIKKIAFFIVGFIIGYNLGLKVPSEWYAGNDIITMILPFLTATFKPARSSKLAIVLSAATTKVWVAS